MSLDNDKRHSNIHKKFEKDQQNQESASVLDDYFVIISDLEGLCSFIVPVQHLAQRLVLPKDVEHVLQLVPGSH